MYDSSWCSFALICLLWLSAAAAVLPATKVRKWIILVNSLFHFLCCRYTGRFNVHFDKGEGVLSLLNLPIFHHNLTNRKWFQKESPEAFEVRLLLEQLWLLFIVFDCCCTGTIYQLSQSASFSFKNGHYPTECQRHLLLEIVIFHSFTRCGLVIKNN